jgi:IS5 family transposase
MIIDYYTRPADFVIPETSDPILRRMDWIMDDPKIHQWVHNDLALHYQNTKMGRRPVPVEVTKRIIVLRRYKKWPYRQAEMEIRDGPVYRYWVRVYDRPVPDYSTMNELERQIHPQTLHLINDRLMTLAQEYEVTQGYKLRLDSSVTESNIHYPTDSSLLVDGVRVLSRLLERAKAILEPGSGLPNRAFSNHTRSARRRSRHIGRLTRPGRKKARKQPPEHALRREYADLINITRTSVRQAHQVLPALQAHPDDVKAIGLACQLEAFLPLVECAIAQAIRRILNDEQVPASDKVVSLFEPHTQIIRRGKTRPHDTEFGHKIRYAEVEKGLIADWQFMAEGNPPDAPYLPTALYRHQELFEHAPDVLATDRHFFTPDNEDLARQLNIKHIALPHTGRLSPEQREYQSQAWFRKAQRFRSGIEGRISVVRRTVQLARCPYHGLSGAERWVGWGIIVADLVIIARELNKPRRRRAKCRV